MKMKVKIGIAYALAGTLALQAVSLGRGGGSATGAFNGASGAGRAAGTFASGSAGRASSFTGWTPAPVTPAFQRAAANTVSTSTTTATTRAVTPPPTPPPAPPVRAAAPVTPQPRIVEQAVPTGRRSSGLAITYGSATRTSPTSATAPFRAAAPAAPQRPLTDKFGPKASPRPPNLGAEGHWEQVMMQPGARLDRAGASSGRYMSPAGTPMELRSLDPRTERLAREAAAGVPGVRSPLQGWVVIKPYPVWRSKVKPHPYGNELTDAGHRGTQYVHSRMTVAELKAKGYIRAMTAKEAAELTLQP